MKVTLVYPSCSGLFYGYQLYNTLMAPNIRLTRVRRKFVRDHFGFGHAKRYRQFILPAIYERKLLYGLTARIIRSPHWQKRACQASARYKAMKECL